MHATIVQCCIVCRCILRSNPGCSSSCTPGATVMLDLCCLGSRVAPEVLSRPCQSVAACKSNNVCLTLSARTGWLLIILRADAFTIKSWMLVSMHPRGNSDARSMLLGVKECSRGLGTTMSVSRCVQIKPCLFDTVCTHRLVASYITC